MCTPHDRAAQGRVLWCATSAHAERGARTQRGAARARGVPQPTLDEMARGHMIADAVAIIGTMDIVFGEIDR